MISIKTPKITKEKLITAVFVLFCAGVLFLGLRGMAGNPTSEELNTRQWKEDGPFELSPERGRFALLYSVIEDESLSFSVPTARFALPDLAISPAGKYVSMFAPGVSFIAAPGYIAGKYFGASQVGAFAVIAFFALLNILLIRAIAIKIGAHPLAANLGALVFAFATPAFAYAVTLYQHHISTFLILASLYLLLVRKTWRSLALIWFLYAFSIAVDNPNAFLMFPIAVCALGKIIVAEKNRSGIEVSFKPSHFLAIFAVIIPLALFLWFNQASHGVALQFSGSLRSVAAINEKGEPVKPVVEDLQTGGLSDPEKEKSAISFFKTRNMLNGFYSHFLSPDRGVIQFAPVVLLGILGLFLAYRKNPFFSSLAIAIIGADVLLYSMWGDPYGGWAFGSRYLIPAYAILAIALALALSQRKNNYIFLGIFFLAFSYSAAVNALGALTTNANPPKVEVLGLEKITGREEKYTYERNWQYLEKGGTKSFIFHSVFENKLSAKGYFGAVAGLVIFSALALTLGLVFSSSRAVAGIFSKDSPLAGLGLAKKETVPLVSSAGEIKRGDN